MTRRSFFCKDLRPGQVSLSATEAHHARNVVRLRAGDIVRLFDGRGSVADARVEGVGRKGVELLVEGVGPADPAARPWPVTLAVAMPKAARQDFLIEKCTELGAEAIWPIVTLRSVVRPGEGRLDHWRQVSIAAAKQSGRCWLPEIAEPAPLDRLAARFVEFERMFFGAIDPQSPALLDCLPDVPHSVERSLPTTDAVRRGRWAVPTLPISQGGGQDACGKQGAGSSSRQSKGFLMVIGPEGGLDPDEEGALLNAGAKPVSLGRGILRVETAAIAALVIVGAWMASR